MSLEQAFLNDIIANPDDDTSRLVYADWLEENARPERAEFIRLQIQVPLLPLEDPQYPALLARMRRLFQKHGKEWGSEHGEFRRGFLHKMTTPIHPTPIELHPLFEKHPIQQMMIYGCPTTQVHRNLAEQKWLNRLKSIRVSQSLEDLDGVKVLLNAKHLTSINELTLEGQYATNVINWMLSWSLLSRPIFLEQLQSIQLEPMLNDQTLDALSRSNRLKNLRRLSLHFATNHSPQVIQTFFRNPNWLQFDTIDLKGLPDIYEAGERLRDWLFSGKAQHLSLQGAGPLVGEEIGRFFYQATTTNLRSLHLTHIPTRGARLFQLLNSPATAQLKSLRLAGQGFSLDDVHALANAESLSRVPRLHLNDRGLDDNTLPALMTGKVAPYHLTLYTGVVSEKPIHDLLGSDFCRNLHHLRLGTGESGPISSEILTVLKTSPFCSRLTTLHLVNPIRISFLQLQEWLQNPGLPNLSSFSLECLFDEPITKIHPWTEEMMKRIPGLTMLDVPTNDERGCGYWIALQSGCDNEESTLSSPI